MQRLVMLCLLVATPTVQCWRVKVESALFSEGDASLMEDSSVQQGVEKATGCCQHDCCQGYKLDGSPGAAFCTEKANMCFAKNKLDESQCNSVCDASLMEVSSVQESGEVEGQDSDAAGTKGKCPRFQPKVGQTSGMVIPSFVLVTIKSAQNVAGWSLLDTVDPYVEFWMGEQGQRNWWIHKATDVGHVHEKYWRARTPTNWNHTSPSWEWTCMMAYDGTSSTFNAQVWDSNVVTRNSYLASASGDLLTILANEDKRGDGEIDAKFALKDKKGKPIKIKGKEAILHVRFEVVRERSMYSITKGSGNIMHPGMSSSQPGQVY